MIVHREWGVQVTTWGGAREVQWHGTEASARAAAAAFADRGRPRVMSRQVTEWVPAD